MLALFKGGGLSDGSRGPVREGDVTRRPSGRSPAKQKGKRRLEMALQKRLYIAYERGQSIGASGLQGTQNRSLFLPLSLEDLIIANSRLVLPLLLLLQRPCPATSRWHPTAGCDKEQLTTSPGPSSAQEDVQCVPTLQLHVRTGCVLRLCRCALYVRQSGCPSVCCICLVPSTFCCVPMDFLRFRISSRRSSKHKLLARCASPTLNGGCYRWRSQLPPSQKCRLTQC